MRQLMVVLAVMASAAVVVHAGDLTATDTLTQEQAQARQFGIFFGGTASQYDLCVKKGFLPKGDQSAEATAKAFLDKTWTTERGADRSAYVQDGWDMMKKEISDNESFYTQDKCASVGKQWTKLLAEMRKK
jgi:hypothetical protein